MNPEGTLRSISIILFRIKKSGVKAALTFEVLRLYFKGSLEVIGEIIKFNLKNIYYES